MTLRGTCGDATIWLDTGAIRCHHRVIMSPQQQQKIETHLWWTPAHRLRQPGESQCTLTYMCMYSSDE